MKMRIKEIMSVTFSRTVRSNHKVLKIFVQSGNGFITMNIRSKDCKLLKILFNFQSLWRLLAKQKKTSFNRLSVFF